MTGHIDSRLADLGINLPTAAAPVANYVPWLISGKMLYVSGQITMADGKPQYVGKVGQEFTIEEGQAAARLCAINLLAQAKTACDGDLDRVKRVVKLGAVVSCTDAFTQIPQVVNGASDMMVDVFGDAGRHTRTAIGTHALPVGVAVEIDGIFELS